jgi:hypothetical protein
LRKAKIAVARTAVKKKPHAMMTHRHVLFKPTFLLMCSAAVPITKGSNQAPAQTLKQHKFHDPPWRSHLPLNPSDSSCEILEPTCMLCSSLITNCIAKYRHLRRS